MRVIAGKFRSRPLHSLRGMDVRPTSDRLREALFNVLTAGYPSVLEGTVWLDLYAGTGAVGIEALSRGASMVYFVESSPQATKLVQQNLRSLGVQAGFLVVQGDVFPGLRRLESQGVVSDFVFLDPPYRMEAAYWRSLEFLAQSQLLRSTSTVIAEHNRRFDPGDTCKTLRRSRKLEQGDAALSFYRLA